MTEPVRVRFIALTAWMGRLHGGVSSVDEAAYGNRRRVMAPVSWGAEKAYRLIDAHRCRGVSVGVCS